MSTSKWDIQWRKLFIEGVVIVASILLAFLIDAWWAGRSDRGKAQTYMELLHDDLKSTLGNIERFGGNADAVDWMGARLARAYYEPGLPSADSISKWLLSSAGMWNVQATLGTAEFLVNSGDLRLIHNDSLRIKLPEYLQTMHTFEAILGSSSETHAEAVGELEKRTGISLAGFLFTSESQDPGFANARAIITSLNPFPPDFSRQIPPEKLLSLAKDPDIHVILMRMNDEKAWYRVYRESMKSQTETMLTVVEQALQAD